MADDLATLYGLAFDPFEGGAGRAGFFATPELGQRLDLLRHLVDYSDLLLALLAPAGGGKSTLLDRLARSGGEHWRVARLAAPAGGDAVAFAGALVRGFAVATRGSDAAPPDAADAPVDSDHAGDEADALERLAARAEGWQRRGQVAVALVDDADRLEDDALLRALGLARRGADLPVRLLLAGEPALGARLAALAPRIGDGGAEDGALVHAVELPPLSEAQTGAYLHTRLAAADLVGDSPFTGAAIAALHRESGGLLGRVDGLARRMLESHARARRRSRWPALPRDWRPGRRTLAGAAGVVLALGSVALWLPADRPPHAGSDADPARDASERSLAIPAPAARSAPAERAADTTARLLPTPEAQSEPATRAEDAPARAIALRAAGAPTATVREPAADRAAEPGPVTTPDDPGAGTTRGAAPAAAAAGPAPDSAGRHAPRADDAAADNAERAPPDAGADADPSGLRDAQWLTRQPADRYTLQLVGTRSEEALRKFVEAHGLDRHAAWFRTRYQDAPWFVVVYGLYDDRAAARVAREALPPELRALSPWPRSIASIRESVTQKAGE